MLHCIHPVFLLLKQYLEGMLILLFKSFVILNLQYVINSTYMWLLLLTNHPCTNIHTTLLRTNIDIGSISCNADNTVLYSLDNSISLYKKFHKLKLAWHYIFKHTYDISHSKWFQLFYISDENLCIYVYMYIYLYLQYVTPNLHFSNINFFIAITYWHVKRLYKS